MKAFCLVIVALAVAAANASTSATFRMESSPMAYSTLASETRIPIVKFVQDIRAGAGEVSFETGHGIVVSDSTQLNGRGGQYDDGYGKIIKTDSSIVKTGSYSYTSPEGRPITINWVADENGFRAEGDSLPVGPAPLPVH